MAEFIQVTTTVDSRDKAEEIARALVEKRLAACVQVFGPVTSRYRWKGEVETAKEWVCAAKTRGELFDRLEEVLRGIHPYELPEIVALPIIAGSEGYLEWLAGETEQP